SGRAEAAGRWGCEAEVKSAALNAGTVPANQVAGGSHDQLGATHRPAGSVLTVRLDLVRLRLDLTVDQVITTGILVKLAEAVRRFLREQVPVEVAIQKGLHIPEPLVVDVAHVDADFFH